MPAEEGAKQDIQGEILIFFGKKGYSA